MRKRIRIMTARALALVMAVMVTAGVPANRVHASEPTESIASGTDCDSFETEAAGETLALNEANFPDAVFREYLSSAYDSDGNGYINPAEVRELKVVCSSEQDSKISSLKGIELFPNLELLDCACNQLTQLDVSKNVELVALYCEYNQLTQLDVSQNAKLEFLNCTGNDLTQLDLSQNAKLGLLDCASNDLTQLDVSKNVGLFILACDDNQLTKLDVSQNVELMDLYCSYNQLTQLDVSQNAILEFLDCSYNYLKSVDTSNNYNLQSFVFEPQKSGSSDKTVTSEGIYIAESSEKQIVAGMVAKAPDSSAVEYSWYACKDGGSWIMVQDWTASNEWLTWTPEEYGDYVLVCKARIGKDDSTIVQSVVPVSYHPSIKGNCQMPYTGEGGGYLIGLESYGNPNQSYQYEMLILDCTLLAQGKPAWVYTTNKCTVSEGNAFWTVWQPQYGYYWTLFRVYDADGTLLDEMCFGFENIY